MAWDMGDLSRNTASLRLESYSSYLTKFLSKEGAIFEPAGVAMRAVEESHIVPGDTVVVLGAGPIGLMRLGSRPRGRRVLPTSLFRHFSSASPTPRPPFHVVNIPVKSASKWTSIHPIASCNKSSPTMQVADCSSQENDSGP